MKSAAKHNVEQSCQTLCLKEFPSISFVITKFMDITGDIYNKTRDSYEIPDGKDCLIFHYNFLRLANIRKKAKVVQLEIDRLIENFVFS
jgi:hypothetical protein